jgi:hypothetical protein
MNEDFFQARKLRGLPKPEKTRRFLPPVVRHVLIGCGGIALALLVFYVLKLLGV